MLPPVVLIDKIYFKLASVFIDDVGRIKAIAQKINGIAVANFAIAPKVIIRGHACDTPIVTAATKTTWGTNMKLSIGRAEAAQKLLIAAGVKPEIITVEGLGDGSPSSQDKDVNRRIEIFLSE